MDHEWSDEHGDLGQGLNRAPVAVHGHLGRGLSVIASAAKAQLSSGGALLAGTAITAVLSYVVVALSARILGSADFGLVSALLGATSLLVTVLRPIHQGATLFAALARVRDRVDSVPGAAGITLVGSGVAMCALLVIAWVGGTPLRDAVRAPTTWAIVAMAPLIAGQLTWLVASGFLTGLARFRSLAAAMTVDALARALVVAPLGMAAGPTGVLLAYALGVTTASAVALWQSGGVSRRAESPVPMTEMQNLLGGSFALTSLIAVLQYVDLVLLRTYAAAQEVGWYAAVATVGNFLFALAAPIYVQLYPAVLSAVRLHSRAWPDVAGTSVVILAGCATALAAAVLFGDHALQALFGPAFAGAAALLPIYVCKVAALLGLLLVGQYALAVGRGGTILPGALPVLTTVAIIVVLRPPVRETALTILGGSTATLVLVTAALVRAGYRAERR